MIYDYHVVFGVLGVLLGLVGYGLYFRSILRGETKPHLFTWLTYALIDGTVFAAQVSHGAGPGSWALLLSVIENIIVVFFALRWGEKHTAKIDGISFMAALVGIGLWWFTSDALVAVVIACGINIFAIVPTFRKAYVRPDQESMTVWATDIFRFGLSIIALTSLTLTTALFPATIVLTNAVLVSMVLLRRRVPGIKLTN